MKRKYKYTAHRQGQDNIDAQITWLSVGDGAIL
jgi:hypothetical protein